MFFKNHKESGYKHNLDLLIISHSSSVSYPTRSGWREKGVRLKTRLVYITVEIIILLYQISITIYLGPMIGEIFGHNWLRS